MAELVYPTTGLYKGPWLLDIVKLEELDEITNDCWKQMLEYRESRLAEEIKKESGNVPPKKRKEIREWIEDKAKSTVDGYRPPSREVRIDFSMPSWVRLWRMIGSNVWFIYFLVIIISAPLLLLDDSGSAYKRQLKAEARELLKDGLTEQELLRANQIILSLQSDFIPPSYSPQESTSSPFFFKIVGWGLLIAILFALYPRTSIGLGQGEFSVRFWKRWVKFLTITIPTVIIIPLLLDIVRRLF